MNSKTDLFRNWFAHLVERAIRLNHYLAERAAEAPGGHGRGRHLVDGIAADLHSLADGLYEKAVFLLEDNNVDDHADTYFALSCAAAKEFRRLHAHLLYIPAPWPRPELSLFLRKIISESGCEGLAGCEIDAWTILLSGDYNFSHIVLSEDDRLSRQTTGIVLKNALTVPAVEKDNPLMWPNLVHELAHSMGSETGVIAAAAALPRVLEKSKKHQAVLREWIHEIVADLIATDLLGHSYASAFVTFAAYWTPTAIRKPGRMHPSPKTRAEYIFRRLRSNFPKLDEVLLTQLRTELDGRLELDHRDDRLRHELFETVATVPGDDLHMPDDELEALIEEIVRLPAFTSIRPIPMSETDVETIRSLAERLERNEVVAARRRDTRFKSFRSDAKVAADFEVARDQLAEVPNKITHIIGAAMLRKLSYATPGKRYEPSRPVPYQHAVLQKFCEHPGPSARRLSDLQRYVDNFDLLVTKSIEGTSIVSFYQQT